MKISCVAQKIKKSVSLVEKLVFKTHTISSLTGIHIQADETHITLSGTNLSAGVNVYISGRIEKTGTLVVPAVLFSQIIQSLDDNEQVLLELTGSQLVISSKNSRVSINTLNTLDYPNIPIISGNDVCEYDLKSFTLGVRSVSFAALVSEIKPEISSVYWYESGKESIYVATDAFRLAEKRIVLKNEINHPGCLLPLKNIPDMLRITSEHEGNAVFTFNDHQMSITHKDFYYTTRLVSGNYPQYQLIIPKNHETTVFIDSDMVMKSLRSTQIFHDRFHQVKMNIDSETSQCIFSVNNNDKGEMVTSVPAVITGPSQEIIIHQKNIQDVLTVISSPEIEIRITQPTKPLVISGRDKVDFMYIMMPVSRV